MLTPISYIKIAEVLQPPSAIALLRFATMSRPCRYNIFLMSMRARMLKLTPWVILEYLSETSNRKAIVLWDRRWSDAEEEMTAAVPIYRNQVLPRMIAAHAYAGNLSCICRTTGSRPNDRSGRRIGCMVSSWSALKSLSPFKGSRGVGGRNRKYIKEASSPLLFLSLKIFTPPNVSDSHPLSPATKTPQSCMIPRALLLTMTSSQV